MPEEISITLTDGKKVVVGEFLSNSSSTLSTYTKTYDFFQLISDDPSTNATSYQKIATKSFTGIDPSIEANKEVYNQYKTQSGASTKSAETDIKDAGTNSKGYSDPGSSEILVKYVEISSVVAASIDNPLASAPPKVAFKINSTTNQYYLKFGYLLQYVQEQVIPLISSNQNSPLIKIQYSSGDMFCLPISISLDPKVCLVRTDKFTKVSGKDAKVLSELEPPWMDSSNENKASIMNIYLNFDFITKCISQKDDKGNIDLFKFLSSLCLGINRALGGINNLEPIVNEEDNTIRIIDTTPIPGTISGSTTGIIQLYGYYGGVESTFVRKVNLQTVISPEFATMITAGATKSGYVKGTEATAFSRWNDGLIDRFNDELLPPNLASTPANDPELNYEDDFIGWITLCYGLNGALDEDVIGNFEDSIIKKNVSIVTEYYKYLLAKQDENNPQSGTIGFIPIKLNFTMDGISGIKIYNKLTLDTNFLPKDYGSTLDFIVTNVNHSLQGNTWLTDITSTAIPKTSKANIVKRNKTETKNAPKAEQVLSNSPTGAPPTTSTTPGSGKAGDLYSWAKGPASTEPDFPDIYIAGLLKIGVPTNFQIPTPTTKKFEGNKTRPGTSTTVLVTQYNTTPLSVAQSEDFYKKIMSQLGAPSTVGNLLFIKAWRQMEGGGATYNPFNSTLKKGSPSNYNTYNVQNYFSVADGVSATVSTLTNGFYPNVVRAFKKGIPDKTAAQKLADLLQRKATFNQSSVDALIDSW